MAMVRARSRAERNWPKTFAISILISLAGLGLMLGYIYFMDYLFYNPPKVESPTTNLLFGMGAMYLILMAPIIMVGCPILIMAPIIVLLAWISDRIKRRRAQVS